MKPLGLTEQNYLAVGIGCGKTMVDFPWAGRCPASLLDGNLWSSGRCRYKIGDLYAGTMGLQDCILTSSQRNCF